MKIALYCPNKPLNHPEPSGDRAIARDIHRALNDMGHDCREIVEFRARWFWRDPRDWARAAAALARALIESLRFRPQLWLTYHTYYKSPDVIGPWVSRALGIPYALFQPMYATARRKDPSTRAGFYLNRLALKACRHAFTNNRHDLEALHRALHRERVTYIAPGIQPDLFPRDEAAGRKIREDLGVPDGAVLLMTACRFRDDKKAVSLHYLFRSLATLPDRAPDFRLLVAGGGPMEPHVRRWARERLPGRVLFSGEADHSELYKYYSAADLFVFPGFRESLGMVYLEAQSCGVPVVALNTDGVPQVIKNGHTGMLVDPRDDGALAEAVLHLMSHPEERRRMGANAARFVREKRNVDLNHRLLATTLAALAGG